MFLSGSNSQPLFKTIRSFALADFGGLKSGCWGNFGKHFDIIKVKEFKRSCKVKNFWAKSFTELIGVVKYTVRPFMVPMFDHHVYKTECFRTGFIRSKIRMFFVFIFVISVLKCQPTTNREALRTKLLDAQNLMQFNQTEFDRLWDLVMSYGKSRW